MSRFKKIISKKFKTRVALTALAAAIFITLVAAPAFADTFDFGGAYDRKE